MSLTKFSLFPYSFCVLRDGSATIRWPLLFLFHRRFAVNQPTPTTVHLDDGRALVLRRCSPASPRRGPFFDPLWISVSKTKTSFLTNFPSTSSPSPSLPCFPFRSGHYLCSPSAILSPFSPRGRSFPRAVFPRRQMTLSPFSLTAASSRGLCYFEGGVVS